MMSLLSGRLVECKVATLFIGVSRARGAGSRRSGIGAAGRDACGIAGRFETPRLPWMKLLAEFKTDFHLAKLNYGNPRKQS